MQLDARIVSINGELGLGYYSQGQVFSLTAVETDGDVIHALYTIRNPDKLRAFATT